MAKRDTGTRTMTNSEMQDRTTADVIGKAAGWDQRHSSGSCERCRSSRPLPDLSRQDGVDSQPLPMPSLRLARLVLHVRGASEQCQTHREPTPTSTIAARSGGTPLLPTALLPPEASARRCSLSLAGQLEGLGVSWSRAPFPLRGGQGPTQPAVRGGGYSLRPAGPRGAGALSFAHVLGAFAAFRFLHGRGRTVS